MNMRQTANPEHVPIPLETERAVEALDYFGTSMYLISGCRLLRLAHGKFRASALLLPFRPARILRAIDQTRDRAASWKHQSPQIRLRLAAYSRGTRDTGPLTRPS